MKEGVERMDWIILGIVVIVILSVLGLIHYNGYQMGYKQGFELGREKINEYAMKVNRAQDERIKELEDEREVGRMDDIERIASFLTRDINK